MNSTHNSDQINIPLTHWPLDLFARYTSFTFHSCSNFH